MKIHLEDISKKYNRDWIFKKINFSFSSQEPYAITGFNGSGKSTLIQIIAGNIRPTEGKVIYTHHDKEILSENIYKKISFCSPHLELIEEFTLKEMLVFHQNMKGFLPGFSIQDLVELSELTSISTNRKIKEYSTGMKQKVKLLIAVMSDVVAILLDEPCTNFDFKNIDWFHQLVNQQLANRLLLICTNNREEELCLCKNAIAMEDFKK